MDANIEQPNQQDMERIATLLAYSNQMALEVGQSPFDASLDDLPRLQSLANIIRQVGSAKQQRLAFQALGMSFGQILAAQDSNYDWWMIDDIDGRDPCLRYRNTDLLVFPLTLISRRVEEGEDVQVDQLYHEITEQLHHKVKQHFDA